MSEIWDEKANNYPRFSGEATSFQKEILQILNGWGVEFKDKTIIDIGAGTGIWALLLARQARQILALDGSYKMLEFLCEDATKFKLDNVHTLHQNFADFTPDKPFDIAFLSMSPAVSESEFEKFNASGRLKIYINWKIPRQSDFITPLLEDYGALKDDFISSKKLQIWIQNRGIKFQEAEISEQRNVIRTLDEALRNAMWHLKINGITADENEVRKFINSKQINNKIYEKIDTLMKILVF